MGLKNHPKSKALTFFMWLLYLNLFRFKEVSTFEIKCITGTCNTEMGEGTF